MVLFDAMKSTQNKANLSDKGSTKYLYPRFSYFLDIFRFFQIFKLINFVEYANIKGLVLINIYAKKKSVYDKVKKAPTYKSSRKWMIFQTTQIKKKIIRNSFSKH